MDAPSRSQSSDNAIPLNISEEEANLPGALQFQYHCTVLFLFLSANQLPTRRLYTTVSQNLSLYLYLLYDSTVQIPKSLPSVTQSTSGFYNTFSNNFNIIKLDIQNS
jgi:hypothetical protein